MTLTPELVFAMKIGSGICWMIVYLLLIYRGFRDRTYGMPIAALCANISWEFIFSFVYPHKPPQLYIDIIWFLLDCVILWQAIRFGKAEFARPGFYPLLALGLITAFAAIVTMSHEFQDWVGRYSAFSQNLMMSILFVFMLLQRQSTRGQSIWIGVFKMVGTLLPSLLFFFSQPNAPYMNFLFISIFIFDLLYIVLIYRQQKAEKV